MSLLCEVSICWWKSDVVANFIKMADKFQQALYLTKESFTGQSWKTWLSSCCLIKEIYFNECYKWPIDSFAVLIFLDYGYHTNYNYYINQSFHQLLLVEVNLNVVELRLNFLQSRWKIPYLCHHLSKPQHIFELRFSFITNSVKPFWITTTYKR